MNPFDTLTEGVYVLARDVVNNYFSIGAFKPGDWRNERVWHEGARFYVMPFHDHSPTRISIVYKGQYAAMRSDDPTQAETAKNLANALVPEVPEVPEVDNSKREEYDALFDWLMNKAETEAEKTAIRTATAIAQR